jgi:aminomethyltransferase
MVKIGIPFPDKPRKTALFEAENWYQKILSERMNKPFEPIKTSNFGEYDMAVNYLTSVLEESKAVEKVAVYNIDHMAQIQFTGKDAAVLLNRVLPADIGSMKIGQCKYTLLLTEKGAVLDDLIAMRVAENHFILVINAGHDITCEKHNRISDADFILQYKKDDEEVIVKDISEELVKVDVQGPFSYKLISELYGKSCLSNRANPSKNMNFFTFNEIEIDGYTWFFSRTGYTNRWGWEIYIPVEIAEEHFKKIVSKALDLGGLLVGLGGRDENRISAGNFGLPLNGSEYDTLHTPVNAPLFNAAIDMNKENFVGKAALAKELSNHPQKRMVLVISEGIVSDRGIYLDGKRIGTVTSSINSLNVSLEKRQFIGSSRKNVNEENGTCAIGLGWTSINPFEVDESGNDVLIKNEEAVRIPVEFYREDEEKNPKGKPVLGYISGDGVTPATAPRPLKNIENL